MAAAAGCGESARCFCASSTSREEVEEDFFAGVVAGVAARLGALSACGKANAPKSRLFCF